jgi:outer membrane lipoprotein-sorting protein
MRNFRITAIVIVSWLAGLTCAQSAPKALTAAEMMSNVVRGFEGVNDFVVDIVAEVKMERAQIPKMSATMYFKRPDKIHFDSRGFLLVPREGLALNPASLQERYAASLAGADTIDGKVLFKLLLAAKSETTRLRQLSLWVDPSNWTIAKIETVPYEGRTLTLHFSYELQLGKYWLPSKLVASFGAVSAEGKEAKENLPQPAKELENIRHAVPRNGTVTIAYSNYRVNVGLDDAIFETKESP